MTTIIYGGSLSALVAADQLVAAGHSVPLVTPTPRLGDVRSYMQGLKAARLVAESSVCVHPPANSADVTSAFAA
ncbi:MAG: hypothetical protein IT359_03105 [Gemmatimonadaceae bacterium]|nr:hypothetical protein [Gemmatimonadaceae bacterium]